MKEAIPEAILQQHVAVLGKTRSGKSSVMRGLVERLLDSEQPVCIIDPKGDWWGIKLSKDGKSPGYPVVIFGGEHADVPINAHAGAHVAELFATGNRPCLIDLGGWMVGDRTRFYVDFASTLFRLAKGLRWLVIDEIHNFAPKGKVMDPDAGKALHWTNRLASEGLGKGLPMLFASQRPQKVHNDTLTSAETLIAMRVLHPSDRGAVSDWIKGCGDPELGAKVLASLAQMDRGEGWAWSPEIGLGPKRVKFAMFETYDSFRPQTAADTAALKGWASVDLDDVKARLATVVQEAEKNDPKLLRAEISRLQAELGRGRAAPPDPAALQAAERRGFAMALEQVRPIADRLSTLRLAITETIDGFREDLARVARVSPGRPPSNPASPSPVASAALPRPTLTGAGEGAGGIPKAVRRVLTALAQYPEGRTKNQVAILSGYAINGGGFNNALSSARTSGWITRDEPMRITPEGLAALGPFDPLPSGRELLAHWYGQLDKAPRKVLEALVEVYPRTLTKAQVANRAGYEPEGGGFNNALSRLRTLELIHGARGGELKASDDFFQ